MKDTNLPPSTKEADDAVATLLQYCAYALRTSFGTVDASSNTEWLYMALYRYFSFDKNSLSILNRSEIDDNEFFNTIYSELSEGRPVTAIRVATTSTSTGDGMANSTATICWTPIREAIRPTSAKPNTSPTKP